MTAPEHAYSNGLPTPTGIRRWLDWYTAGRAANDLPSDDLYRMVDELFGLISAQDEKIQHLTRQKQMLVEGIDDTLDALSALVGR